MAENFWETKSLSQMNEPEWESLCDGCAQCCLCKVEDADTGTVHYTDVHCRHLNAATGRCGDYDRRTTLVPDCVKLTPENLHELSWMPATCAYRLLYENKPLAAWHPLISGDPNSVHAAGISVRGRCVSEAFVHETDIIERIVHWRDKKS